MRLLFLNPSKYIVREKPKDYAFMEESEEILKNHPATWNVYPKTVEGAMKIIEMEYTELTKSKDKSKELVHLATACLHAWRIINNVDKSDKS